MGDSADDNPPRFSRMDEVFKGLTARMLLGKTQLRWISTMNKYTKVKFEIIEKEYEILKRVDDKVDEPPSIEDLQNSLAQLKLEESRLQEEAEELKLEVDRIKNLIDMNQLDSFDITCLQ